jgi:hypothetical protein
MKPSIYGESTSTWMSKSNELLNINQTVQQMSLLERGAQVVDEFGFLLKDISIPRWKQKAKHGIGRGGYSCKQFCRNIPKIDSRRVSYAKTKEFYCATCSIAMKCVRCKCCGRIGRREPRSRNRFTRALINGNRYIE